ncbi:MAG: sodium-translocating pyrophosphatase [candidate division KSB1 bacterium]|nr:sodium-translocating pyrophosphatase [candidate division KSB1 bacterium]MDZ7302573.1 sodium-translocating pyrophosphatase [candidate division KSB1 bacterium]MDZ7311586.1 sodium-translocating pyrophosphatase [candidate division KSB1 bacterium]
MELGLTLGCSIFALAFAVFLAKWVLKNDDGTPAMRTISDAIREGAEAFLARQYKTIYALTIPVAAIIFILYAFMRPATEHDPVPSTVQLATYVAASFIFGAICSGIAGYMGMFVSIRSNIRTASASRSSLNRGLQIALRGGAVSGLFVVAMSLLGVGGLFAILRLLNISPEKIPFLIVGYGFGASFVALFAQLGGGIYTKAADVGADLVGKVEAGIPEDDPRNPAVIADLVGDNVGDCAGRGADLFESTAAENIGAMILGVALYPFFGLKGVLFPLVVRAFGLLASIAGVMIVRTREDGDPMHALNRGYYLTTFLAALGFGVGCYWLLNSSQAPQAWWHFWLCGLIGLATAMAFVYITQYYTEYKYRPVKSIAVASQTGPATNIITGFSVALECTALPVVVIAVAIIASYYLGQTSGVAHAGLFGTAVATMGMLGTAAYILAMDTFGPIADNAGGIIEMSQQPEEIRRKTDRLDAVGNTTKALTKGYAIGSAALAAFLLFSAYLDEVRAFKPDFQPSVDIAKPEVFIGGLLGAMLIFLFAALAIRAVGKAAYYVINEVRRQFRENPGILAGTVKPSYRQAVDIVTSGALKEMVLPGILTVGMPIIVGLIFRQFGIGAEVVAALLMVGTIGGILVATMLNNGGGAWDNAKKYVETGQLGGKGSDTHKAAVVGDTVGDPFKDTAGPSLHVVIKLLSTITLVLAPLFI